MALVRLRKDRDGLSRRDYKDEERWRERASGRTENYLQRLILYTRRLVGGVGESEWKIFALLHNTAHRS